MVVRAKGRLGFFGDEEAVDEIGGGEAGAHGAKGFEMTDKIRAHFCGECPKGFFLDDVQTKIPSFGAMLVQDLGVSDMQTV